jgi:TolB protein
VKPSVLLLAVLLLPSSLGAERQPVLPEIDLPHPYYYRELYLPQLTSGPSSVGWAPDSNEVVYSMGGSLWRQKLDSGEAVELTHGDGYDYQPDWSPDGKSIVYVSYRRDAMELRLLDVASGKSSALTSAGGVNLEPRWSPDGKRIVFVSTSFHKRFHVFRADLRQGALDRIVRLTGETRSDLRRYYYSPYDMEISPVWTRDGREILYVSNRGHIHGTGGFWRMKAEPGSEAHEIHYEETSWKARPDFSPDGSRMVYSSYLGGQWHQLWVMPAAGGDGFPVSYGEGDETNVRWSPDGKHLAFVSNRHGNSELWTADVASGRQSKLGATARICLSPARRVVLDIRDAAGPAPARVSITGDDGRFYAPDDARIAADDGFDRAERAFEAHYFYSSGRDSLAVPESAGKLKVEVLAGFDRPPAEETFTVSRAGGDVLSMRLGERWKFPPDGGAWVGGDLHVHMNYGGTYRNDPAHLLAEARAEGLAVVNSLIVNKEQRFPDIAYNGRGVDRASTKQTLIAHGQEFHTSYWGHRGVIGIERILLPGYAGYPNTAASSLVPMNADVYDLAHAEGALVGAVHPFDAAPDPFAKPAEKITDELPVDVALGKLDYMEIVGFSDHKATAEVWYRFLNLGYRIPAGAGTDATTNYAAPIRGMVGFDRVYAWLPAWPSSFKAWLDGVKRGRTFATNGPLLHFTLGGKMLGSEVKLETPKEVPFTARLHSNAAVDHLEVVCNGKVAKKLELQGRRTEAEVTGTLPLRESGWCLLRASSDRAVHPVLDRYAYATTSPVYVALGGAKPRSPDDARYFAAWIARSIELTSAYPDWNSPAEKQLVLERLAAAKTIYEKMQ